MLGALIGLTCACGSPLPSDPGNDAGLPEDAGVEDAGQQPPDDAGSSAPDAGEADAGIPDAGAPDAGNGCPPVMANVAGTCVDRYEAYVVRLTDAGLEVPHSPYLVVDTLVVRAKVAPGVVPQGYISQVQAAAACNRAGKRLCAAAEFQLACSGTSDGGSWYPYGGKVKKPGFCNEGKGSSLPRFYGTNPANWTYTAFNDPRLNQWDGGLFPGGAFAQCVSPFGVYDCVGNLHEWGSDAPDLNAHGRFRGGFYGDAEINGPGCRYVTSAHGVTYHDYSTGFRCCADAGS